MRICELSATPDDDLRRSVLEFVERVESQTATPALSDHLRIDLAHSESGGPLLGTVSEHGTLLAMAQVSDANATAVLEVVVAPGVDDAAAVRDDVAATAIDAHRRRSGTPIVWWLDDPTEADGVTAARLALTLSRELFEMRRALPLRQRASVETRSFRPGADDEAWLAVNNRAFAGHGEQGGWTLDTLRGRFDEPWFDPAGFRVHDVDGQLAAFCWTKLHTESAPTIGEIYVIAVDPAFHGRGLGKQLTLAGLDSIADRGVTTANLYVDAANTAAVSLYDHLGFHVHRRRAAFASQELAS